MAVGKASSNGGISYTYYERPQDSTNVIYQQTYNYGSNNKIIQFPLNKYVWYSGTFTYCVTDTSKTGINLLVSIGKQDETFDTNGLDYFNCIGPLSSMNAVRIG